MSWFLATFFMWIFYYPLVFIFKWILIVLPPVHERLFFEQKNGKDLGSRSFSEITGVQADLCFEFSSEGEYQQVASLIEDALRAGKKVELVFFSPSVEKTVVDLAHNFSTQVRYLRYPLLTFGLNDWITAPELILVRYDFFPNLLVWTLKGNRRLKLLWMTMKRERIKNCAPSMMKQLFLKRSGLTFFASRADREYAAKFDIQGTAYDFRMEQIRRRNEKRLEKFSRIFPVWEELESRLAQYPREKRLIVGNAWPYDMELLKNVPADVLVLIVPHQLKETQKIAQTLKPQSVIFNDGDKQLPAGNIIILNQKGVLCELYQDFGRAYVGGGFGASVHSILEPLVGGCEKISCGPKHHRSTEYDMAREFGRMTEVGNSAEFLSWLTSGVEGKADHAKLVEEIKRYGEFRKDVISC